MNFQTHYAAAVKQTMRVLGISEPALSLPEFRSQTLEQLDDVRLDVLYGALEEEVAAQKQRIHRNVNNWISSGRDGWCFFFSDTRVGAFFFR